MKVSALRETLQRLETPVEAVDDAIYQPEDSDAVFLKFGIPDRPRSR